MREYLSQIGALLRKDLMLELRTRERVASMAAFAVLVGILFNYAFDRSLVRPQDIAAGLIWMTIVFGGMLGMGRSFRTEEEEDAMQGILASPVPRDAIYLAKVAANLLILLVVVILTFFVFWLFFGLHFGGDPLPLVMVVLLGTLGFVAVSTLFSAVSSRTSMGETLLPILVFPVLVPVVIYGVSGTARIFAGRPIAEIAGNIRMLGAFALVALAAGAILFRFVVEE